MKFAAFFVAIALAGFVFVTSAPFVATQAQAQATCRNKCNDEEQACLRRTNNKSQCGSRAQVCAAKCK